MTTLEIIRSCGLRSIEDLVIEAIKDYTVGGDEYVEAFCRGIAITMDMIASTPDPDNNGSQICSALTYPEHLVSHYEEKAWSATYLSRLCQAYAEPICKSYMQAAQIVSWFMHDPKYGNVHMDDSFNRDKMYQLFRAYAEGTFAE